MVAALAGGGGERQTQLLAIHLESHPSATAQDVYKFLHQGIFGPGHLIDDRDAAARYLNDEIDELDLSQVIEMSCEPLGGDPAMVRVHLRPYVREGRDGTDLLDVLVASAGVFEGGPRAMRHALDAAAEWLRRNGRSTTADELDRLRDDTAPRGFPPVHHSESYRAAYHPAYRVVLESYARERGWCDVPDHP
jgi:hypothetical protein